MTVPNSNLLYKNINGEKKLALSYSQMETFIQCPHKWYMTYVEGNRMDVKQEALGYGSAIHKTVEDFFVNGCTADAASLVKTFERFQELEDVAYNSTLSMLECGRDAMEFISWITGLFKNKSKNIKSYSEIEQSLVLMDAVGIEEDFVLPYKLPHPININGVEETKVNIIGSIDLHLRKGNKSVVIDWKSGRKSFTPSKLKNNLQHPIYSFYIMKKYKTGLPKRNFYFFTRLRKEQRVIMEEEDVKRHVESINNILEVMYDFESGRNNRAIPTPLCWWCEHKDRCEFKSNYQPKQECSDN